MGILIRIKDSAPIEEQKMRTIQHDDELLNYDFYNRILTTFDIKDIPMFMGRETRGYRHITADQVKEMEMRVQRKIARDGIKDINLLRKTLLLLERLQYSIKSYITPVLEWSI